MGGEASTGEEIYARKRDIYVDIRSERHVLPAPPVSRSPGFPAELCLVDEHELRVVCQIIEAAVWFIAAEETSIKVT